MELKEAIRLVEVCHHRVEIGDMGEELEVVVAAARAHLAAQEALKEIANTAEFFTQHGISDAAARGGAERIVERARATLEGGE